MTTPYDPRENAATITGKELANRLRLAMNDKDRFQAPGALEGIGGSKTASLAFADALESLFGSREFERHYVPYRGNVIRYVRQYRERNTNSKPVAILLRGAVEVQSLSTSHNAGAAGMDPRYATEAIFSAPAILGLFEAISATGIQAPKVKIYAGVQSIAILANLSEVAPWWKYLERESTFITTQDLAAPRLKERPNFLAWNRSTPFQPFWKIAAGPRTDWAVEIAIIDIAEIVDTDLGKVEAELDSVILRDFLHREALRQLGSGFLSHVPGYRLHRERNDPPIVILISSLNQGTHSHHTHAATFAEASSLFPVRTLTWNILDYMRNAQGASINVDGLYDKLLPREDRSRPHDREPSLETVKTFYEKVLWKYVLVPSVCANSPTCLYSPLLMLSPIVTNLKDAAFSREVRALRTGYKLGQINTLEVESLSGFFDAKLDVDYHELPKKVLQALKGTGFIWIERQSMPIPSNRQ